MTRAEFEGLARDLVARAVRAKGFVALSDAPEVRHLYQQVGRRWTLVEAGSWGSLAPRTRLVAIAVTAATRHNNPVPRTVTA